jgi:hypothetical protein
MGNDEPLSTQEKKLLRNLTSAIKKQQSLIRKAGFEPTWELFSKTFGWYQTSKNMDASVKEVYMVIWNTTLEYTDV